MSQSLFTDLIWMPWAYHYICSHFKNKFKNKYVENTTHCNVKEAYEAILIIYKKYLSL